MLQTFFHLLSAAASSRPAREAERQRLISTLEALHSSLAAVIATPTGRDSKVVRALLSNSVSDFFCQAELLASSKDASHIGIRKLAVRVEEAVMSLDQKPIEGVEANGLLVELQALIAALSLPDTGASRQSAA